MVVPGTRQSNCPICSSHSLPEDASVAEKLSKTVVVQGRVNVMVSPEEAHYPPYQDYCTLSLYPRRGPVKYLKFQTRHEMERWDTKPGERIQAEGCLHIVDGKELVFDVLRVITF